MTQGVTLDPLSLLFLSNLTKTTFPHTLSSCPASPDGSHTSSGLPWGHRSQCTEILCRTRARSTSPATTYVYFFLFKHMSIPFACNAASFPGLQLKKTTPKPKKTTQTNKKTPPVCSKEHRCLVVQKPLSTCFTSNTYVRARINAKQKQTSRQNPQIVTGSNERTSNDLTERTANEKMWPLTRYHR